MRWCVLAGLLLVATPALGQEAPPVSPVMDRWNKAAIVSSLVVNQLDLGWTLYGLGTGRVVEVNPIFRRWQDNPTVMTIGKMGVIALTHYALWKLYRWAPKLALIGTLTHASLVGWAVVHNARTIRAAQGR